MREFYMVMPEDGGRSGTVFVTTLDGKEQVLHGAFASMRIVEGQKEFLTTNNEVMDGKFGQAVAALPPAPTSATLYFLSGKDELTKESKIEAERIYQDFLRRGSPEIWIIGHTDTVGSVNFNDLLSLKRAERVRQTLLRLGIPEENIVAKGMGKRQPRVPTRDNIDEPMNRRVEISVR